MMEMPQCNADCFQLFLNELSKHRPNQLKVLIEDNGAFHKAKSLKIPDNIVLIFQPPYSPEVKSAENIWARCKRDFTNKLHKLIQEVSEFIQNFADKLMPDTIIQTTAFQYVLTALYQTEY